ncbi:MAG TPA: tyrosine-protein phosphatase [Pyrinomonadaceae bacterium]|jgi:protein tyrosine/serine phosphatase|nr:tyrosine-protein phosphatase [Pyrinomonadaceae bacterium]
MKFIRKFSIAPIAAIALIIGLAQLSFAKPKENGFPNIKIDNFGKMDELFYRGGRPKPEDLKNLAALGIKTIIDLTDNSRDREQPAVEAAGMRYVNIPIVDKKNPSDSQIEEFLKVANDPATGKFYVHCAGGRHRTGVMGAIYRFNHDHWNYDQAYAEMKQFDFYTSNGHGKQLDFVQAYWQQFQAKQANSAVSATSKR